MHPKVAAALIISSVTAALSPLHAQQVSDTAAFGALTPELANQLSRAT